jgi:hypothetical protein
MEKIIKENQENIPLWEEKYNNYIYSEYSEHELGKKEYTKTQLEFQVVLYDIFKVFVSSSKIKYKHEDFYVNFFPFGINLLFDEPKTKTMYNFGIDENGYFMTVPLMNVENLKYMEDNFWRKLIQLNDFAKLNFIGDNNLTNKEGKKYEKYFKSQKSSVFQILRNYFLFEIFDDSVIDIGELNISWQPNISFEDLLVNGYKSFKILYDINYQLWHIGHLKEKRKVKE